MIQKGRKKKNQIHKEVREKAEIIKIWMLVKLQMKIKMQKTVKNQNNYPEDNQVVPKVVPEHKMRILCLMECSHHQDKLQKDKIYQIILSFQISKLIKKIFEKVIKEFKTIKFTTSKLLLKI